MGDEVQELLQFGLEFHFLHLCSGYGHTASSEWVVAWDEGAFSRDPKGARRNALPFGSRLNDPSFGTNAHFAATA